MYSFHVCNNSPRTDVIKMNIHITDREILGNYEMKFNMCYVTRKL